MIQSIGKYADVRAAGRIPGTGIRPRRAARPGRPGVRRAGKPGLFQILMAKRSNGEPMSRWLERELREGGCLQEYLRREKALSEARQRAVARAMRDLRPNPKSDVRLLAKVPAREYHRWRQEDPHFWKDNANLRSLRRDNEPLRQCIFV